MFPTAKRRHSREPHTIFNNPEKFPVRKFLRMFRAQVRRLRIHSAPHHRVAASIIAVADGAVIRKVRARIALHFR